MLYWYGPLPLGAAQAQTVTVTAPIADATASATAPTTVLGVIITAPIADASASATAPVAVGQTGPVLTPPVAEAAASAPVPTLKVDTVFTAPLADASGSAPTPAVQVATVIVAPQAIATASAPTPVSAGPVVQITLNAPAAQATASGLVPTFPFYTAFPNTASAAASAMSPTAPSRISEPGALSDRRALRAIESKLGYVEHMVMSPTGEVDYPIVGDWECDEQVPGGYWTATGLVSRRERKTALGVYKYGSAWNTYEVASGELIWRGKIIEVLEEEGQLRLNADGVGKLASEKSIPHRLLYQSVDMGEWQAMALGSPFDKDPGQTFEDSVGETAQDDGWNIEIGDSIKFIRPTRTEGPTNDPHANHSQSEGATWYATDLAPPGVTRVAFRLHILSPVRAVIDPPKFDTPSYWTTTPFPIFMNVQAGQWREGYNATSQSAITGWLGYDFGSGLVVWYPDPQGAGTGDYGENFQYYLDWDISMFYRHSITDETSYLGSIGYVAGPGYEANPYAYSDRDGSPSFDWVGGTSEWMHDKRRVWDNRPFNRNLFADDSQYPKSSNYADPNAIDPFDRAVGPVGGEEADWWDPFPVNWVQIAWQDKSNLAVEGDEVLSARVHMFNVRVNGIAPGDYWSATDLVKDIAGRMGLSDDGIDVNGMNVLPLDIREGTWADALDHASLMTGWVWRIITKGLRRRLEFFHWGRRETWIVADERSPHALRPTQRYSSVSVPYSQSSGKVDYSANVTVRDPRTPPGRWHPYGPVTMDTPMPSRNKAEFLAHLLLEKLRRPHFAGDMTVTEVRTPLGFSETAYMIHAGDLVEHWPSGHLRLRVQSIRKTYEDVQLTFEDHISTVEAITARMSHRVSAKSGGGM